MMPSSSSTISSTLPMSSSSSSSSSITATSSPCAACKFLRRKCQPDCVFAPYFPPDNPQKFVHVHRVFGASNVTKILNELPTYHREDAVNSLAYEADMRLKDPVYGCVGVISILQHQLRSLQSELVLAKAELSKYQNHAAASVGPIVMAAAGPNGGGGGQFLNMGVGREGYYQHQHHQHHQQQQQQQQQQMNMLVRNNYDTDMAVAAARMGGNGNGDEGYDGVGMVGTMMNGGAAMAVAANIGIGVQLGGQFLKTSANGGEDRPTVGPS